MSDPRSSLSAWQQMFYMVWSWIGVTLAVKLVLIMLFTDFRWTYDGVQHTLSLIPK